MKIELSLKKSLEKNAAGYFEKAKKLKKKIAGAEQTVAEQKKRLEELKKNRDIVLEKERQKQVQEELKKQRKEEKAWYEKFHWFFTSEGFLCIGGKDATTNEIVVKKHAEKDDLIFHTEEPGSPFVVLKCKDKKCGKVSVQEAAQQCAVYSNAWKRGFAPVVYYVNPEQVTKQAKGGEYVPKGAFMVYGSRNYVKDFQMRLAIGIKDDKVIGGPVTAIDRQTKNYVIIHMGDTRKSELAKKIQRKIGGDAEEIIQFLPGDGDFE